MFAVWVDASAGWRGVKITPAISRELDGLTTDPMAKPGVGLAASGAGGRHRLRPRYGGRTGLEFTLLVLDLGQIKQRVLPTRDSDSVHQSTPRAQRTWKPA